MSGGIQIAMPGLLARAANAAGIFFNNGCAGFVQYSVDNDGALTSVANGQVVTVGQTTAQDLSVRIVRLGMP